jgi:hypothetical protein
MIKRLLLILALGAAAAACSPSTGSSGAPLETGPTLESVQPSEAAPSEAAPSESAPEVSPSPS